MQNHYLQHCYNHPEPSVVIASRVQQPTTDRGVGCVSCVTVIIPRLIVTSASYSAVIIRYKVVGTRRVPYVAGTATDCYLCTILPPHTKKPVPVSPLVAELFKLDGAVV